MFTVLGLFDLLGYIQEKRDFGGILAAFIRIA